MNKIYYYLLLDRQAERFQTLFAVCCRQTRITEISWSWRSVFASLCVLDGGAEPRMSGSPLVVKAPADVFCLTNRPKSKR